VAKPETLTLQVSKYYADLHQTKDPKFRVSVLGLRKVAERALADWKSAAYPGADPKPWMVTRVEQFLKALDDQGTTPDVDLLPAEHPLRKSTRVDAWQELCDAEERIHALQKQIVDGVTRADVRKSDTTALIHLNRRLAHLFEVNFAKNMQVMSVTGISRERIVEAAALVHEELERRDMPIKNDEQALYAEAIKVRSDPRLVVQEGELFQRPDGIVIKLGENVELFVPGAVSRVDMEKAAARFTPAGSALHVAFLEPREAPYVGLAKVSERASIGKFGFTRGARTDAFTELFVSGALRGVLVVGKSSVMLRKSLLPYVLTENAVQSGYMPPEGESALPPSLEWDVPPELRYWKSACGQDPREIRDQLVQAQLFTDDTVRLVNEVPRRTFVKHYVAEPFPASPDVFAELMPEARLEAALYRAFAETPDAFVRAVEFGRGEGVMTEELALAFFEEPIPEQLPQLVSRTEKFLVGGADSTEARKLLEQLGRPFTLPGLAHKIFVASHPVPGEVEVEYIDTIVPVIEEGSAAEINKREVHVLKGTADEDERFVLGVVLEPETVDSQGDIYSAEEIRKSAYRFMAFYQNTGLMHQTLINDSVRIVESYVAPVDCEIGGQAVKKGTWLMGVLVESDELWGAVKAGVFTGFSIGGSAIRTAEDTAA